MNINLDGLTCIQEFEVPIQVANKTWFNNIKIKGLNSKLNLNNDILYITLQMYYRTL
jgi:hypothetical protein